MAPRAEITGGIMRNGNATQGKRGSTSGDQDGCKIGPAQMAEWSGGSGVKSGGHTGPCRACKIMTMMVISKMFVAVMGGLCLQSGLVNCKGPWVPGGYFRVLSTRRRTHAHTHSDFCLQRSQLFRIRPSSTVSLFLVLNALCPLLATGKGEVVTSGCCGDSVKLQARSPSVGH